MSKTMLVRTKMKGQIETGHEAQQGCDTM